MQRWTRRLSYHYDYSGTDYDYSGSDNYDHHHHDSGSDNYEPYIVTGKQIGRAHV